MKINLLQILNERLKSLSNASNFPSDGPQKSNESLSSTAFEVNVIEKIIEDFDKNKPHGHNMLSICMLKLSDDPIFQPLNPLFKFCIEIGQFLAEWKKAKIVPVFKKVDERQLQIYC